MKKINWLDHLANLLVVILGITVAFYLEGYREAKSNRKQEREYVHALIADLKKDEAVLDTLGKVNSFIAEALVELSNASVGRSLEDGEVLKNHMFSIQYNPPFSPQSTTYESLKASGNIDIITDFQLRNKIVDLYEQYYKGVNEYDEAIDEQVRDFIRPFYVENVRFTSNKTIDDQFLTMNEFKNIIFGYRYLFVAKEAFYHKTAEQTVQLREELELYVDSKGS
ncbi:MAG: hypothetical protein HRT61_18270 [Ekhidna sp.]|nr:hypothetical protein [Ekhidna sp.]